ncbi:MAG: dTDP-glucose 4,6-dehydratase [Candidatus Lloydbacteria bacterium RIFCSPHIGHO2_02_FULL_54_17]|uniref:dTDP-glucose 4,6-dehydratase n=1 Tax=Candidatus Lloydbacteria bacterium RIFCSPHIGHO2_02_FULL_54_17 TaxID=1798664 RepID=A0A1G2DD31_9BACT|nr:MAG: dTDP-glucose 4,6-dehydratase [Candidatus Lloydbacteria bacterium RIFCSPHIGHO2_01_FULL_54_11]OGZ11342.1 MAG: dTDP-glucose 4,6-dehydratase [Candidatus Lloydbacteria bacterium RIFCSPHIGHO2_02_FULL_54_17]OGZ13830.1 MAG: dTDP-glucose 4,6-dehydratase [Candidatus Lloydbacteria bacterium RIFCSPLOWO2_01_FULL_54_18]OGZ15550.1 MAG: dTDP-glucose 4,6-dehydratase [Candidatus Lloydbacteria bacterium RIFCSPLOWO2_02_FULL_54_12]
MKLLITGGMGFIGSNFIRHVYNKYPSYFIINYDALTYAGNPENLSDIEALESVKGDDRRYVFVKGDIADAKAVHDVLEAYEPEVVVNFAAESHVDRSLVDSGEFIRSNIVGVQNLLQLARKYDVKFLQISTDEVYGDVETGYSTEESPMRPSNPYAASKAGADLLVQSYMRSHNAPVMIVRGSNNFGPYQYPEKLIPLAVTNIIEGATIPVHGNGKHIRTWLHTDDFAEGIDLVLHQAKNGSIYNIAGDEDSNLALLKRIAEYLGASHDKVLLHVGDRPGADMRYAPHAGRIERELGWTPKRTLVSSLPEIIDWYVENPDWWKKVKAKKEFSDHYEKQRQAKYY